MAFHQRPIVDAPTFEGRKLPVSLEEARIRSLPGDAFYIPEFITPEEEQRLLHKVTSVPFPRWTQLTRRRLQTWPSALTKSNTLLASPLPPWLSFPIISRFTDLSVFSHSPHQAPNHVLINEYQPGQGIMPHEDGAAYYPLVATVSLGAPIILDVYEKRNREEPQHHQSRQVEKEIGPPTAVTAMAPQYRILQERRSLLVTAGKLYTDYLHGIVERETDGDLGGESVCNWELLGNKDEFEGGSYARNTRISLTYRDVLKVSKLGNTVKFLGSR